MTVKKSGVNPWKLELSFHCSNPYSTEVRKKMKDHMVYFAQIRPIWPIVPPPPLLLRPLYLTLCLTFHAVLWYQGYLPLPTQNIYKKKFRILLPTFDTNKFLVNGSSKILKGWDLPSFFSSIMLGPVQSEDYQVSFKHWWISAWPYFMIWFLINALIRMQLKIKSCAGTISQIDKLVLFYTQKLI
jgi:hypothetical protein